MSGLIQVKGLRMGSDSVAGVITDRGEIPVDQLVLAAGSWTPRLLWHAGLYLPVYPMKGYSLIMDLPREGDKRRPRDGELPRRIISDGVT